MAAAAFNFMALPGFAEDWDLSFAEGATSRGC
jgi:hypothetical protein